MLLFGGAVLLGGHGARLAEVGQVVEGLGHHGWPGPGEEELIWVAHLLHLGSHQGTIGARRLLSLGFRLRQDPTAVGAAGPLAASGQAPAGPLGEGGVALRERRGRRDRCARSRLTSAACLGRGRRWKRKCIFSEQFGRLYRQSTCHHSIVSCLTLHVTGLKEGDEVPNAAPAR